ncbi:MFS general substrate transporter [Epithele typhae]|uniref:MFS general substrate transporter n=1 Tax=Epithele typhae TaxID=378194 RepID=UPI0020077659|nr:MFS general substrate transporter [Epithele typhae]KAH9919172.1 MFS general substrate transporter [Epithele typhae]
MDGGLKAWLTVAGASVALFVGFGQVSAFGTFQTYYAHHQLSELSPSTISWIGSLQFFTFFFSGGFIGRIFDTFGPKRILALGTILLTFATMMISLSTKYYQFILAQGVLFGLSIGMIFFPSLAALSTHFEKRRGAAVGIAFASAGLGGVVYPIMFNRLFSEIGFAWTVRIVGFMSLFLGTFSTATVSSNRKHGRTGAPLLYPTIYHDVHFMVFCVCCMIAAVGVFIPFFYLANYAIAHGIAPSTAFYLISCINAGSIVGRLVPPMLSDRVGRFNVIVPSAFALGPCALAFWPFAKSLVAMVFFALLWGAFSGALIAMMIPCVAQISSDPKEIGTRIGVLYSTISFGAFAGGPAAGAILQDLDGSYLGMMWLSGAAVVVCASGLLWIRLRLDSRIFVRV